MFVSHVRHEHGYSFQSHIPCFEHLQVCGDEFKSRNLDVGLLSSIFILRSVTATQRWHKPPFSAQSIERETNSHTYNYKRYIGRYFILPFRSFWNSSLSTSSSFLFPYLFYSLNFLSQFPHIFLPPAVIPVVFLCILVSFLLFHFFLSNPPLSLSLSISLSLSPAFAALHFISPSSPRLLLLCSLLLLHYFLYAL